jgi:adenosine deaminase
MALMMMIAHTTEEIKRYLIGQSFRSSEASTSVTVSHTRVSRRSLTLNLMKKFTDEFFQEIPKTDLHVHLDGSVRIETLIELAKEQNFVLPSYDPSTLKRTVFKKNYKNLEEYLEGFKYTSGVMQDEKSCERVAYEFAVDNYKEGVRYFEVRFAPQLHASIDPDDCFGIREVLKSVDRGLKHARDMFNRKLSEDKSRSKEPRYEYGIICCAMRKFFKGT